MSELRFEWDSDKAVENLKKHGVSFEEAQTIFYDDYAIEFYDNEHSEWENRFLMVGLSTQLRLLLVCHCFRESESVIRLISAREATRREGRLYRR